MAKNFSIDFTEKELKNISSQTSLLNKDLLGKTNELKEAFKPCYFQT